jgi:hypothetical protein
MKKIIILIFSILLVNTVFATDSLVFKLRKRDYKYVDSISQTYKTVDEAISKISLFKEDVDKARAVYNFVASYMTYEYYEVTKENMGRQTMSVSLPISIKTRKGICFDYAVLYDYICEKIGLECVVVNGIVKENWDARHSWNVVTIDSKMYILDVTYADASDTPLLSERDRKKVDYNHFLIPPEYAITYYYPEDVMCHDDLGVICINCWQYVNLGDVKDFDKKWFEKRKEYDIYFSFASKYQCLEKPRSIYYFVHTPIIGDDYRTDVVKYGYIKPKSDFIPLRRMPDNNPNLYIKYFYYDIEPVTNLYDEKYGNGFRYQYIK